MPRPLALALLAVLGALAVPAAAAAATGATTCPGTFQVLHDDGIGTLQVPAGAYRIQTTGGLSCSSASSQLTRFLQDFDGVLPRPWRVVSGQSAFVRGNGPQGFSIRRAGRPSGGGGGGGGRSPADGTFCPTNPFRVLNDDRIGRLGFPRGRYDIILLGGPGLTCRQASAAFRSFLARPDGRLPRPWVVGAQTGTFTQGRGSSTGFRVDPAGG